MSTVQECELKLRLWTQESDEKTVLSHAHMIGVVRALVEHGGPPEKVVLKIKNYLIAFDRLREEKTAGRTPPPAA